MIAYLILYILTLSKIALVLGETHVFECIETDQMGKLICRNATERIEIIHVTPPTMKPPPSPILMDSSMYAQESENLISWTPYFQPDIYLSAMDTMNPQIPTYSTFRDSKPEYKVIGEFTINPPRKTT